MFCGPDNTAVVTGLYRTSNDWIQILQLYDLTSFADSVWFVSKWLTKCGHGICIKKFSGPRIELPLNQRRSEIAVY